jgi:methionyl aminopeptidase
MINIRNKQEIDGLRSAANLVSATFHEIADLVHAGTVLSEIDNKAEKFILKNGGETLYKGIRQRPHQRPFPGVICTSLNNQICHGIPDGRILKEGDIVGIDIGLRFKGWCGDECFTYKVGAISPDAENLVNTSQKCLEKGINACEAGKPLGVIGAAIQELAESQGYSVVREYGGHGIGRELWEDPFVPHIGPADRGVRLREGMVINIEPMINLGKPDTRLMPDEWSVETADGSLSSQFEHTIVITDHGPEILTHF